MVYNHSIKDFWSQAHGTNIATCGSVVIHSFLLETMSSKIEYIVEPAEIHGLNDFHIPGIFGNFSEVMDGKIAELDAKNTQFTRICAEFYRYLRSEVDTESFSQLQREFLTKEQIEECNKAQSIDGGYLKYIDPLHWFSDKLSIALDLDLNDTGPLDILDINTGCGQFPTIARYFGHNVVGVDLPRAPALSSQRTHLYDALCDLYRVRKIDLKIEPFKPFRLSRKFDLVTGFMTAFNVMDDLSPYTIDAWKYFFKTLDDNVLKNGGRVYLNLTRGKLTDETWEFLKSKSEWIDEHTRTILIRNVASVYQTDHVAGEEHRIETSAVTDRQHLSEQIITGKQALVAGNIDIAFEKFSAVLKIDSDNVESRRALARIHTAEGKTAEAIEQWLKVHDLRPDIVETWLRLGRLYKSISRFPESLDAYKKYLKLVPHNAEAIKEIASHEKSAKTPQQKHKPRPEKLTTQAPAGYQHIAIAGVSYCGSTLLARVLGNLPNVENVGESHWLIGSKDRSGNSRIDFDDQSDKNIIPCSSCGLSCPVFTCEFRKELQQDPSDWYQKIAGQLGCKTLVSADKNYNKLTTMDPALQMDAIVLFKNPLQAWYSNYKKISRASATLEPVTDIAKYMATWAKSYQKFLDNFETAGDKIFLDFEAFCADPTYHLERICSILQIENDSNASAAIQHCFGGNSQFNRALRKSDSRFEIRKLSDPELPDEHIAIIENDKQVQEVFSRLQESYERGFGIVNKTARESIESALKNVYSVQEVNATKSKVFLEAALDQERCLRNRHRKLARSGKNKTETELINRLLNTVDWDKYRSLQQEYLTESSVNFHVGMVKYLNLDYWLRAKYRSARDIGLVESPPMQILDLGAGPGHFPLIARALGHDVVCTDIDVSDTGSWNKPHIYDALIEFFSLDRRTHRIQPFEKMPSFGKKFDLITGFMVKFNVQDDVGPWGPDAWTYFLNDLSNNQLTPNGRLMLKVNLTGRDTSVKYINDEVLDVFRQHGAIIDERGSTVNFPSLSATPAHDAETA